MILDTNALSAFFEGDAKLGATLARATGIFLPVIVLGEYRFGLLRSKKRRLIEPVLDKLQANATVLAIQVETVGPYAEIRDRLKSAGTPIPSNDLSDSRACRPTRAPDRQSRHSLRSRSDVDPHYVVTPRMIGIPGISRQILVSPAAP